LFVAHDRHVQAFDERAPTYERGWLGQLHHRIVDRTVEVAVSRVPQSANILDVGCGTGLLLCKLAARLPDAVGLLGVDPAPKMVELAKAAASSADPRFRFASGVAEHLPVADATFDLVVSTTSFDHWADQLAGLAECARVLRVGGHLVLADQVSNWLLPSLLVGRRGRARTVGRVNALLTAAGLHSFEWQAVYAVIIRAVSATK
jgi:ubiquinone/menaquinone biosynthesis C-methylase UbiE